MNKKEVLEIRKQFQPENSVITRICGCYVDHEKEKKFERKDAFLSLPEEEICKYLDIFKKTVSGSLGKTLLDMEFPLSQEEPGGTQEFLLRLRNSRLEDEALVEEFYEKVIDAFDFSENYYIILIHMVYDIPGKTSDGFTMDDASENVYEGLLCSICPVGLSAPGLSYNATENRMENRLQDWVMQMPLSGFLFPTFSDRTTDIHHVLYYVKKAKDIYPEFIDAMFGTKIPMTADRQKEVFQTLITETLGESCDYEVVKEIYEQIYEEVTEQRQTEEPFELSKQEIRNAFTRSGVSEEAMEQFETIYEQLMDGKETLFAENVMDTKKLEVTLPDVCIKVKPDRTDLVETRVLNGRKYFVIPADGSVEINGLDVVVKKEGKETTGTNIPS